MMIKRSKAIATLALFVAATTSPLRASDDKHSICDAAITAYAANIQSFTHYQCRYSYARAEVKSVDDAVQGRFINARSYDSRLLVDGDKDCHEELGPVEDPDPRTSRPLPGYPGLSYRDAFYSAGRYLSDGKREISIIPQFNTISFYSGEGVHRGIGITPLGMHLMGHRGLHGPDMKRSQPDEYEMLCDGLEELDGLPLITVRFRHRQHGYQLKYCFDGSRGYLPARMETIIEGKVSSLVLLTHAIEVNGQRWFPERSVALRMHDQVGVPYNVSEIKVLDLDVDCRPPAEEFAIRVTAGTPVEYVDDPKNKRLVLRQAERIGVDDLAKLEAMLHNVATTPLMDTAIPRPDRRWYWLGAVAGVAIALGSLVVWRWRRFHSH
jgi:hypothetical protein